MKPDLLLAIDLAPSSLAKLEAAYAVHRAITAEAAREHCGMVRAVLTNGTTGLSAAMIEALPKLEIICAQGVGFEGIDIAAAKARGITVTHGPGTNASCVADHAMGLLLSLLRDFSGNDARVRAGKWREGRTMRPTATGRRLGLLGLGQIGRRIAQRAAAFDMSVAYHSRQPRLESGLDYVPSLMELALWCDDLVVAVPGGAETRHIVDAGVMAAIGPKGFLVNVGRGSVLDTDALVAALRDGELGGAGLDVIEGEPDVPQNLCTLPNVLLTPHMAGRSPASVNATIALVLENLDAFFAGRPVLTPVPGP